MELFQRQAPSVRREQRLTTGLTRSGSSCLVWPRQTFLFLQLFLRTERRLPVLSAEKSSDVAGNGCAGLKSPPQKLKLPPSQSRVCTNTCVLLPSAVSFMVARTLCLGQNVPPFETVKHNARCVFILNGLLVVLE